MMRSYGMNYENNERYEELASRRPTTSAYSRDIIRSLEELELNRIDQQPRTYHGSWTTTTERPYATLPKRSRSHSIVNLEDRFLPRDLHRLSRYPKSLQDLKYLEIEAILGRDPQPPLVDDRPSTSCGRPSRNERWVYRASEQEFLEALAAGTGQVERYEPGKVHYEREYRIYGKDTVALIFYKTCYL